MPLHLFYLRQNLSIALLALTLAGCGSYSNHYIKTDHAGQVTELQRTYSYQGNAYQVTATLSGAAEFNATADDIIAMPHNSMISIIRVDKALKFELTGTGTGVKHRIWLDGALVEETAEYRQLLQHSLSGLFRNSPVYAQQRVAKLLHSHGADSVLEEIQQLADDETRLMYLSELSAQTTLSESQQLLLIESSTAIHSDYSHAKALAAIAKHQQRSQSKVWQAWCEATQSIDSDYELTELLLSQIGVFPAQEITQNALLKASATIGSDYEKSRLMQALASASSGFSLSSVLQASVDIESDYETSQLLQKSAALVQNNNQLSAFLELAKSIESSYEMQQALNALPFEQFDAAQSVQVIRLAAGAITSDHELANTLASVLRRSADAQPLYGPVKDALKTISSDSDKVRVLELFYPEHSTGGK